VELTVVTMEKGEADTTKGRPDNKNDVQIMA
jgi:hypothetical protein